VAGVGRRARRRRRLLQRPQWWLFDVKTIHAGGPCYEHCALTSQSGAVAARAARVPGEYVGHARRIDRAQGTAGAVEAHLRTLGTVSGLAFGAYAEASQDVHGLLASIASTLADAAWRRTGARCQSEALSFYTTMVRRRVGVAVARAMARHRLDRVQFIGVSREAVRAHRQRRADVAREPAIRDVDFFAHQTYIFAPAR
jgi:hypothetical protein